MLANFPVSSSDDYLAPFHLLHPPVEVELVGQHPPVISPGLGCVQAAAQLLSDGDGDAERVGPHQRGDVTGRVQQRRVDALGILQSTEQDYRLIRQHPAELNTLQRSAPAAVHILAN